jgi:tetratricopeptide (TPR) repeat protein
MKVIFAIVFAYVAYFPTTVYSQKTITDSKAILENADTPDSTRMKELDLVITSLRRTHPDSARYYAFQLEALSKKAGSLWFLAHAYSAIGYAYNSEGDLKNAMKYFQTGLGVSQQSKDLITQIKFHQSIGAIYGSSGDLVYALESFIKASELVDTTTNHKGHYYTLMNLGVINQELKNFDAALAYFLKAKHIAEDIDKSIDLSPCYNNLAESYKELKGLDQAILYEEKALKAAEKSGISQQVAIVCLNLALSYVDKGSRDKASHYYRKALIIEEHEGNKMTLPRLLSYIGEFLIKEDIDSAINLGKRALLLAKETGDMATISTSSKLLYSAYKQLGKHNQSLEMLEINDQAEDSLKAMHAQEKTLQAMHKMEMRKMVAQMAELNKKELTDTKMAASKEKYLIVGISTLVILTIGVYLFLKIRSHNRDRSILLEEIERLKQKGLLAQVSLSAKQTLTGLDKEKTEKTIGAKLNETDWSILSALYENPFISNNDLSDKVSRSLEGVSSSLRKMYTHFDITERSNKKLELLKQVLRISSDESGFQKTG